MGVRLHWQSLPPGADAGAGDAGASGALGAAVVLGDYWAGRW